MSHPSVGNDQLPLEWNASKMDRDQGWDHNLSKPYQTWTIGRQKEVRTLFDVTIVRALPTRYAKTSSAPSSPTALEERKTFSVKSLEFLGQWGQHRGCTETSEMYHVDHSTVIICHQYDMWYHAYIYISIYLFIYLFIHSFPSSSPITSSCPPTVFLCLMRSSLVMQPLASGSSRRKQASSAASLWRTWQDMSEQRPGEGKEDSGRSNRHQSSSSLSSTFYLCIILHPRLCY